MLNLLQRKTSNPPPPLEPRQSDPELPDKQYLYGEFLKGEQRRRNWQDQLHKKSTYKALDMAADEMGDVNTTVNKGMGVKELGIIGAIILGALAFMRPDLLPSTGNNQQQQQAAGPADSEYDVRFYNRNGELIDVPQRTSNEE